MVVVSLAMSALPFSVKPFGVRQPAADQTQESVWLPHRILLGAEEDVDSVLEAVAKIRTGVEGP
jgi:hypothetical protein